MKAAWVSSLDTVFLDRDGTIIEDRHYLSDPAGVALLPGAGEALAALAKAGMRLFLVTNQSGIGRGLFPAAAYAACQERLRRLLADFGVCFTAEAMCPHRPEEGCACRKPGIGLWEDLRLRHGLDPRRAAMIGDKRADVAFGQACGFLATALVLTGHGRKEARSMGAAFVADSLPAHGQGAQALVLDPPGPGWPTLFARDVPAAVAWLLGDT